MKIRLERRLVERARICADEVDATLADWSSRALKQWRLGKFGRVAKPKTHANCYTRASVVATLPGLQQDATDMRLALLSAVKYCEKQRIPRFKTHLVEGVHYIVDRSETA